MPRKVLIDVGGHTGETVAPALDPRFGFDAVYTPRWPCTWNESVIALMWSPAPHIDASLAPFTSPSPSRAEPDPGPRSGRYSARRPARFRER